MKPWHKGLPEATEFSLFPPAGKLSSWTEDKERTKVALQRAFFSIADISLDEGAVLIPILGEAGEGGRGIYAGPPSPARLREIERELNGFDLRSEIKAVKFTLDLAQASRGRRTRIYASTALACLAQDRN